ncbi:rhodanese-like domain-containing protein [Porticoccaceae bacterium]|nr:rhodanese-like domain-containing protein [Porticoccaceae bacterium]
MNKPVTHISASKFNQKHQSPEAKLQVIDVRTQAEVNTESLDGCAHFPLQDLHCDALQDYLNKHSHDPSQPVYLLCASGQRATRAAEQLQGDIDNELVIIEGGINALKQLGIDVPKGTSNVISLERQVRITAGSLVVIGVALGLFVNPGFYGLSAFVGAGLIFAGVTDSCGMGMALARMPWNK